MAHATDLKRLKSRARMFWPEELAGKERTSSIIPRLVETQDKFIGILYVADAGPTAWMDVLAATDGMPANLFLKHLMVLGDVGGELLKRLRTSLSRTYRGKPMTYSWRGRKYEYRFRSLGGGSSWSNPGLGVDGRGLSRPSGPNASMVDVSMVILHGASVTDVGVPEDALTGCMIGSLIGEKDQLDAFVRQRYIWVSRITGGAKANALGQLAQAYVRERLKNLLPDWTFARKTIPGVSQTAGRTDMSFDFVGESPKGNYCAIEVSFQVTTNSVIERKAGQAADRQNFLHRLGHQVAYVIDGAGNFERASALQTICQHTDCIVTFGEGEIEKLAGFLRTIDR